MKTEYDFSDAKPNPYIDKLESRTPSDLNMDEIKELGNDLDTSVQDAKHVEFV